MDSRSNTGLRSMRDDMTTATEYVELKTKIEL